MRLVPPGVQHVDDIFRRRLIHALKNRRWESLDAERAAAGAAGLYRDGRPLPLPYHAIAILRERQPSPRDHPFCTTTATRQVR
jgi:hypothetical protein